MTPIPVVFSHLGAVTLDGIAAATLSLNMGAGNDVASLSDLLVMVILVGLETLS